MIFDCIDLKNNNSMISDEHCRIQENTVLRAVDILKESPGVILGDDVGMGKTYEAMALAYYYSQQGKVLILTPNWLLNRKWHKELERFFANNVKKRIVKEKAFGVVENEGDKINSLLNLLNNKKIVVCPVTVFSKLIDAEKSAILYNFKAKFDLSDNEMRKLFIMAKIEKDYRFYKENNKYYCAEWLFNIELDKGYYSDFKMLYDAGKINGSNITTYIKYIKYNILNKALPRISMIIIDEAHKMKNQESVTTLSFLTSFRKKYRKTIFLTATPFQLSPNELINIFEMFSHSFVKNVQKEEYIKLLDELKIDIIRYKENYEILRSKWVRISKEDAKLIEENYNSVKTENNVVKDIIGFIKNMEQNKNSLEVKLRKLIIRNTKDKYYRKIKEASIGEGESAIVLENEHFLPFAFYEKYIFQLYKEKGKTFIPTVEQSFTSSFESARDSSMFNKSANSKELKDIKSLLYNMISEDISHPKVEDLVAEVIRCYKKREKNLVFVKRLGTAKVIKRNIQDKIFEQQKKEIQLVFGEEGEKKYRNLKKLFSSSRSNLSIAFEENYIYAILGKKPKLTSEMYNKIKANYEKNNKSKYHNYRLLKREIEAVVLENYKSKFTAKEYDLYKFLIQYQQIDDLTGIEDVEETNIADDIIDSKTGKKVTNNLINKIVSYRGIWYYFRNEIRGFLHSDINVKERINLTKEIAKFLVNDGFLIMIKEEAKKQEKEYFDVISDTFIKDSLGIRSAIKRFLLDYMNKTDFERQGMLAGLKTRNVVECITGEVSEELKNKYIEGFNMPFYPYVLVALTQAQEGLDLQKECSTIIHYDLEWNPASMEQRVGRIDRINSKISRDLQENKDAKLKVVIPYINNTIDEQMYKVLKIRERWFSLLLGGGFEGLDDEIDTPELIVELPKSIFIRLQINLSVD